jgi:hypothetical protein
MSSGSTNFTITRDELIKGALRLCGVLAQGESPTTDQVSEASEALNMLVKAWEADGMPLWAIKTTNIPLTASTASYRIGVGQTVNTPKPLKVLQVWNRDTTSNVDIPLRILTKQEYNMLGNKTSSGNPVQVYYDPQNTYGDLYVFPVPGTTEATDNQLYIVYQRPFEDFDASTDEPDFPQEWFEALKYGLASRLAGEYQLSLQIRTFLKAEAKEAKDTALSFGTEEGSFYFQVDRRGY